MAHVRVEGMADRLLDDDGGELPEDERVGVDRAGRGDDEGVAVAAGVGRIEGARQAVVTGLRDEEAVDLREPCRW